MMATKQWSKHVPDLLNSKVTFRQKNIHFYCFVNTRGMTHIKDIWCFFFCLTDKRRSKAPPALRRTPSVAEV
jgi:hypothetical protein